MIFNTIVIVLFIGIAYFHYAQGFFSATMSAFCAAVAAVMAIGYHEVAVNSLLQGAAGEYANALCLCAIFALVYIILRVMIDSMVPGNVRIPVMVDRIGGAAMGIVAAIFAAGIVAIAAQLMPFGANLGGYARYKVETREELNLPPNATSRGHARTGDVVDEMIDDKFTAENKSHLWIPVDDMVVNFVSTVSDGGSLSGDVNFTTVHPEFMDETFANRLGIQTGGKHNAMNLPGKTPQVTVPDKAGVFRVDTDFTKSSFDGELVGMHQRAMTYKKPSPSGMQLVVRVMFNKDAGDPDGLVRISPGSVRLVAGGQDFWPIGTLDNGKTLFLNKIDDFLLVDVKTADHGADFLFDIDDPSKVVSGGAKDPNQKIKDGVFIEVKRLAKIDLSGTPVIAGITPSKDVKVERKQDVGPKKPTAAEVAANSATEFIFTGITVSNKLFSAVNTGVADKEVKGGQAPQGSGTFSKVAGQLSMLDIQPVASLTILAQGSNAIDDLYVPPNMKLVQIQGAPPAEGGDAWAWSALSKWQLIDGNGKIYSPAGGWARVSKEGADRMAASYDAVDHPKDITGSDGRPIDVWVAFLVPAGTPLKQVKFNNKNVKDDLGQTAQ